MMNNDTEFDDPVLDVEEAPPPPDADLTRVATLAERAQVEEAEVIRCTAALSEALKAYRGTVERELPEAMAACHMSEFKLIDGTKVSIDSKFIGGKLTNPIALDWVEENGGAPLVKTLITLELPPKEIETAREVLRYIAQHPKANSFVRLEMERSVHAMTIGAFAKEQVEARKNPPLDLLGVMRRITARVGARRPKTVELKGLERR